MPGSRQFCEIDREKLHDESLLSTEWAELSSRDPDNSVRKRNNP